MSISIGEEFGKYRILSEIGHGGMGVVFLAEDTRLERCVAIKALSARLMSDESFLEQLRQEAKVVASFSHPNVVHINTFDVVDGIAIIEMEYIDGGSLSHKLQCEIVTQHDVVRYAHDVAAALAYCHGLGSIHRDIKPSNILIDAHDRARLADFGIAKAIASSERGSVSSSWSGLFQGTPSYAPPEAWEGASPAVTWDIYSLGVVMYEALTGVLPYEAGTPLELVRKMATTSFVPVQTQSPSVSDDLARLVDGMLEADLEARIPAAEIVMERLQSTPEWIGGRMSEAPTLTVPKPRKISSRRETRRIQRSTGVSAIVVTVAIALLAAWYFTRHDVAPPIDIVTNALLDSPAAQDTFTAQATDRVEDLLRTSKGTIGGNAVVLNAQYQGNNHRASVQWLAVFEMDKLVEIIEYSDTSVALYKTENVVGTEEYEIVGDWAGYQDTQSSVLRYGIASGRIRVSRDPINVVGTLSRHADQDGSIVEVALSAAITGFRTTDTGFIVGMESAQVVQSLLYNELIPRSLAWASEIEAIMPSFLSGAVVVPLLDKELELDLAEFLEESVWKELGDSVALSNRLIGVPAGLNPTIKMVADNRALYLLVSCVLPENPQALVFELCVLDRIARPVSASPTWSVRYDVAQARVVALTGLDEGQDSGPELLSKQMDGRLHIGIRIPFRKTATSSIKPLVGDRWRMNAVLHYTEPSGELRPLARWGFPDESEVWHGAVISFVHGKDVD